MSTFTQNKSFEQPGHNQFIDTWDTPVNADWADIDNAFGGVTNKNSTGLSGNVNLVLADYQPLAIKVSGLPTAAITYVVPSGVGGMWIFFNNTTGGFNVGLSSAAGGSTVLVPAGQSTIVTCDGTSTGMKIAVNVAPAAGGSNTQVQYNSGGLLAGSANMSFDGTTLDVTGLGVAGNVILGSGAGSTLTLNGNTVTIPNGLTIGSSNLLFLDQATGQVAIGTATPTAGDLLTVAGSIKITTGGLVFSDGTQLLSASALAPGGASGNVQFNNGSGGFGADSVFTYNSGTHLLSATALTLTGALTVGGAAIFNGSATFNAAATLNGNTTISGGTNAYLGALSNGTTATTQAVNDGTTKVATTAYMQANGWQRYQADIVVSGSSVASIDITGIPANVKSIMIVGFLMPVTNGVNLWARFSQSGVFKSTASDYFYAAAVGDSGGGSGDGVNPGGGATHIDIGGTETIDNTSTTGGADISYTVVNLQATVGSTRIVGTSGVISGGIVVSTATTGGAAFAGAVDGIRLMFSSGNIDIGSYISILALYQ